MKSATPDLRLKTENTFEKYDFFFFLDFFFFSVLALICIWAQTGLYHAEEQKKKRKNV